MRNSNIQRCNLFFKFVATEKSHICGKNTRLISLDLSHFCGVHLLITGQVIVYSDYTTHTQTHTLHTHTHAHTHTHLHTHTVTHTQYNFDRTIWLITDSRLVILRTLHLIPTGLLVLSMLFDTADSLTTGTFGYNTLLMRSQRSYWPCLQRTVFSVFVNDELINGLETERLLSSPAAVITFPRRTHQQMCTAVAEKSSDQVS